MKKVILIVIAAGLVGLGIGAVTSIGTLIITSTLLLLVSARIYDVYLRKAKAYKIDLAEPAPPPPPPSGAPGRPPWRLIMTFVISLIVLISCLWILVSGKSDPSIQKWASGAIGMVGGFWLREGR